MEYSVIRRTKMEKWIWTELLAFDIEQDDYGVGAYL